MVYSGGQVASWLFESLEYTIRCGHMNSEQFEPDFKTQDANRNLVAGLPGGPALLDCALVPDVSQRTEHILQVTGRLGPVCCGEEAPTITYPQFMAGQSHVEQGWLL